MLLSDTGTMLNGVMGDLSLHRVENTTAPRHLHRISPVHEFCNFIATQGHCMEFACNINFYLFLAHLSPYASFTVERPVRYSLASFVARAAHSDYEIPSLKRLTFCWASRRSHTCPAGKMRISALSETVFRRCHPHQDEWSNRLPALTASLWSMHLSD